MNKYDTMDIEELVNILNARDTEIEILSRSCQRLLKEKYRLEKKFVGIAMDLGMDSNEFHEFIKDEGEKDPDSGFEGSTLFPKGEGRLVFENAAGTIHKWD